jgi:hypothetical protein
MRRGFREQKPSFEEPEAYSVTIARAAHGARTFVMRGSRDLRRMPFDGLQ